MTLRLRIAVGFAAVALATAAVTSIAIPAIVGHGFAQLQSETATPSPDRRGQGAGNGPGPGPQAALHASQIQQDVTTTLIVIAIGAGLAASVVGFIAAGRLARPLTRLATASRRIAAGNLAERSGLADRTDEFGDVGRAFDEMAGELQHVDEERRRFMEDAVHELRTPITVIEGTAGALEEGVFAPEPRHLRTIREQAQLLSRIVDDLRTISLAEAGQLTFAREIIDVTQLLQTAAVDFEARARAASQAIEIGGEPRLRLEGDERRVRQVLAAIVDNALRHTPPGGHVRLNAGRVRDAVRVSVEDTGPGFARDDLPHVFDRFYQADRSRDRRTGSSGLGLSIVRALVDAQGGRTGAANLPSGGASVWFELPGAGAPR